MLRTILTALALTVALGVTASIASADSIGGGAPSSGGYWYGSVFKSPTGNLVCKYRGGLDSITCGRRNDQRVVSMTSYGAAREGYRMTFSNAGIHTLYYGQSYTGIAGGIVCRSYFDGMTCQNDAAHGFFISRTVWDRW